MLYFISQRTSAVLHPGASSDARALSTLRLSREGQEAYPRRVQINGSEDQGFDRASLNWAFCGAKGLKSGAVSKLIMLLSATTTTTTTATAAASY